MSEIEKVKEQVKKIDAGMDVTDEAATQLAVIPSMFRGMALKAIVAKATEQGATTITQEIVDLVNKERTGG